MTEANIKLTEQEANALIDLIDTAVKTKGIVASASGLHFVNKIQEAFKDKEAAPVTEDKRESIQH